MLKFNLTEKAAAAGLTVSTAVTAVSRRSIMDVRETERNTAKNALEALNSWDVDCAHRIAYATANAFHYDVSLDEEGFRAIKELKQAAYNKASNAYDSAAAAFKESEEDFAKIEELSGKCEYEGLYVLGLYNLGARYAMAYLGEHYADAMENIVSASKHVLENWFDENQNGECPRMARNAMENFLSLFAPQNGLFSSTGKAGHLNVSAVAAKEYAASLFTRTTSKGENTKRIFKGKRVAASLMADMLYRALNDMK